MLLLCIGCTVFFFLSGTFSSPRYPPFVPMSKFPRKIWQSWKVNPLRFETRDSERALSWTTKNPKYRWEVLTDENAENYVEEHFGPSGFKRPDIVSTFKSLSSLRIIQADLLRYLIMYAEGGVYADIDVEAIRPIDQFVPKRFNERNVNMIIGVETDEPDFKDHPILGSKATSFCQWTFMCKPRLPVMMKLIENIMVWINELSQQQGKPIEELELGFDEVLSGTGPSAFTDAILTEMSILTGEKLTWDTFHDLEESQLVGGILVLTSEAFAAGTGHSKSGNHGGRAALVKHHFHASSWTTNHPRYKHPIYGEVEKCNWDPECVALWDANTAFFHSLPEEQQLQMISIKDSMKLEEALANPNTQSSPQPNLGPPAGMPPPLPAADTDDSAIVLPIPELQVPLAQPPLEDGKPEIGP